jgi:hypothetical protein
VTERSDRARSALWHARNRAYREWVEANRELLEYLATSPDVPDHLRPAGSLPPRSFPEEPAVRPDAISRPEAARPDVLARPDFEATTLPDDSVRTPRADENRVQNGRSAMEAKARPDVRTAEWGDTGGSSYSGTRVSTPPAPPHPAGGVDRVAKVVKLVAAAGAPLVLTAADKRAIRNCAAEPTVIANAFAAAARREWGDEWLQENLSARLVIQRLSGYLASRGSPTNQADHRGALPRRPRAEERLGPAETAYSWEGGWGPDRPPPISPVDQQRAAVRTAS